MGLRQVKIILLTFMCCLVFITESFTQKSQKESHIEVSLRMVGHQILLSYGDSTSNVLPITKENDRYKIEFESAFSFEPNQLVATINKVIAETNAAQSFIAEVEKCETGEVVYSYEMKILEQKNIVPCAQRGLPKACYNLFITLLEPISSKDSMLVSNQSSFLIIALLLVLFGSMFIIFWRKKTKTSRDPNIISLGDYQLDKRNTELLFDEQKIELTSKEADLLILLYDAVNTTMEREVILRKVWGDEGAYVGRTLDVFISKLRKKLQADPKVKIVNIRGVGYKLVMDV